MFFVVFFYYAYGFYSADPDTIWIVIPFIFISVSAFISIFLDGIIPARYVKDVLSNWRNANERFKDASGNTVRFAFKGYFIIYNRNSSLDYGNIYYKNELIMTYGSGKTKVFNENRVRRLARIIRMLKLRSKFNLSRQSK